ncbi:riboflavin synthase [Candidatus Peregrinibacteria bacterium]|nr:riboflavin synthase [Candidatus Peregrinibacteria bacterium]
MFTGIVREIGRLAKKTPGGKAGMHLSILSKKMRPQIGASIAVNGVCLTITKKTPGGFMVDVVSETLARTNLGKLKTNAALNLEPSMKIDDALDGHFVLGHVDTTCNVISNGKYLTIELPKKLAQFIAEKGSVALNGVSLTVAAVAKNSFTVALIPFTKKHTNLGGLKNGDSINVEIDILARYAHRYNRLAVQ